ncbi:photosynthetic complex putative assembly protein PuhB [Palleronia caenipelagi]|uniref:PH domain-containing protein n=1 Tax=Palleronia caenipelagi TaxID=2489174 RepID=A0A547Q879_9RHOB|nr:photosynthetic complex putative assembly protein PuhB [Palleronia caenipelagi]TRD22585.1 PH domain-containing protein [Palleronia caenipelagi]
MPRDYRDDPDITIEPIPGLPGALPRGETILWQGRPQPLALARASLGLTWVAGYFALLAVWRVGSLAADLGWAGAMPYALPFLGLGLLACGMLYLVAYVQARATVYTITTERVAMRIGAALTLTVNLPLTRIVSADLGPGPGGTGSISLTPAEGSRLSYAVLWPHIRPWRMREPQPTLRCIEGAEKVAALLGDAATARQSRPELSAAAMAAE